MSCAPRAQSYKIFETPHALAILDAFPMAQGHALLLPKANCVGVTDMPPEVASAYLLEIPRLAKLVQAATGAPGVKIVQNNGAAAGQEVFHAHFHVIPRYAPSDPMTSSPNMLTPEQAKPLLAKMQADVSKRAASKAETDASDAALAERNAEVRALHKMSEDAKSSEAMANLTKARADAKSQSDAMALAAAEVIKESLGG